MLHSKYTEKVAFSQSSSLSIGKISALNPTFQSCDKTITSGITSTEYEIGCFKTPQDLFLETLGDFTQEANASKMLMECKELTKQSGYNVFALGHGGLCMSGPNAQDTYYEYKPASNKNKCSNGIGFGDHSVVYTFGIYYLIITVQC